MEQNPYISMTEDELLSRLDLSRKHADEGKLRNADNVISRLKQQ